MNLSRWLTIFGVAWLAAMPTTSNYKLNSFGFGTGGTANSTTSNYALEGTSGEVSGQSGTTSNYQDKPGYVQTQQANAPPAPTFTNPSNFYDKLKFIINIGGNPTDAKYALAISDDNFATTKYVKSDLTVGSSLTTSDYQTYTGWGGGSGSTIIGLAINTTYKLKVKATQGKFTESAYGPAATAATVNESLTFSLSTGTVSFGALTPNTVNDSPVNVTANIDTNADTGAAIYLSAQNAGLHSTQAGFTIASATADLSTAPNGFGAQIVSTGQTSGGPLNGLSPFNSSSQTVGKVDTAIQQMFISSNPIVGGQGVFKLKAKPTDIDPSASDYAEVLTIIGAAIF